MKNSKSYYIFVPSSVRTALQRRAELEDTTVAALVREAIQRYLAKLPEVVDVSPPGEVNINVRLSREAESALEQHTLVTDAPRHSLNAIGRLALSEFLGTPWPEESEWTIVSTRLPEGVVVRLRNAARAYSREALIRRAIAAYRERIGQ